MKRKMFSEKQRVYLAYHRDNVFEKHGRSNGSDEREPNDAVYESDDFARRDIPTVLDDINVVLPDK